MLHVVSLDMENGRKITTHKSLVICDDNKNPVVIVVEYEPGLIEVLTQQEHPVEFRERLVTLDFGLRPAAVKPISK